ncbi:hypothetical protein ACA106_02135 [Agrobacterium pusense]|uniref:hypothetical protein n=1 Tax=Agrobacterium pusense TaxID=648995 RepID=UPI0035A5A13E
MKQVTCNKDDFLQSINGRDSVLVCSASFEDRCLSAPLALDPANFRAVIIFRNDDVGTAGLKNCEILRKHFGDIAEIIVISKDDPTKTADEMSRMFHLCKISSKSGVHIDITCFTKEALLILLRVMSYRIPVKANITLLYNVAEHYGGAGQSGRSRWLSKGVSAIRPVLGYAGSFLSSKPIHLVVLSGYEIDRLSTLFDSVIPSKVTILRSRNTLSEPKASAEFRSSVLLSARRLYGNASELLFDPYSIKNTISMLSDLRRETGDECTMSIAPLSTKMSTISVGLFAMINEDIQLIYAKPAIYNKRKYSTPSEKFIVARFNIDEVERQLS